MKVMINKLQAFNAVSQLFQAYYIDTFSDDLGGLLSSMSFLSDGSTADPAMWEVWIEFLDKILQENHIENSNLIDPLYAFLAINPLLEYFFIKNVQHLDQKKLVDPVLWKRWLKCVQDVLSTEDSRDYLTFV